MRLYTNSKGQWVGTQAEAKTIGAEQTEVPTDKPSLLAWLNNRTEAANALGLPAEPMPAPVVTERVTSHPQGRPHPWVTIRECAEKAALKDLSVALAIYMNRVDELLDDQ
jgi:hypothetical protein